MTIYVVCASREQGSARSPDNLVQRLGQGKPLPCPRDSPVADWHDEQRMHSVLADVVLVVHFAFVLFVVGGLAATWAGAAAGWRWVRNFWFRTAHLAAIAYVAAESLLGVWCPLTMWEDALRGRHEEKSFVARWIHRVMFYDLPESLFTALYVLFAAAVAATWWWIRPTRGRSKQP